MWVMRAIANGLPCFTVSSKRETGFCSCGSTPRRRGQIASQLVALLLCFLAFSAIARGAETDVVSAPARSTKSSAALERPELRLGRTIQYDYDPPTPGSYRLPRLRKAGDGAILHLNGKTDRLRNLVSGRISILSFIYTRCADPTACPYATGVLHKIHSISEQDGQIAKNLRLITFSFDPNHDTPRVLSGYSLALQKQTGAPWLFVTTKGDEHLAPILDAYGQRVDVKQDPQDPLGPFSHVLRVYLMDRQGFIRNIYSTGMLDPRVVLADIRTLLLEEKRESARTTK